MTFEKRVNWPANGSLSPSSPLVRWAITPITEEPNGGHLWLTLDLPLDESELMTEAVRNGVTFVPGAAMLPEASHLTHLRLSYGFLDEEKLVEGTKRLGRAIRSLAKRPAVSEALPIA